MFHVVGIGKGEHGGEGEGDGKGEAGAEQTVEASGLVAQAEEQRRHGLTEPEHGGIGGHDGAARIRRGGQGNVSGAAGIEHARARAHEKERGSGLPQVGGREQEQHGNGKLRAAQKAYGAGSEAGGAPLREQRAQEHSRRVKGKEHGGVLRRQMQALVDEERQVRIHGPEDEQGRTEAHGKQREHAGRGEQLAQMTAVQFQVDAPGGPVGNVDGQTEHERAEAEKGGKEKSEPPRAEIEQPRNDDGRERNAEILNHRHAGDEFQSFLTLRDVADEGVAHGFERGDGHPLKGAPDKQPEEAGRGQAQKRARAAQKKGGKEQRTAAQSVAEHAVKRNDEHAGQGVHGNDHAHFKGRELKVLHDERQARQHYGIADGGHERQQINEQHERTAAGNSHDGSPKAERSPFRKR